MAHGSSRTTRTESPLPAAAGQKRKRGGEVKFYAVKAGKTPGIYHTWEECLDQVKGHKGAVYKAFPSSTEAQAFIDGVQQDTSRGKNGEPRFYGVQVGKIPGVYTDWPSAQTQIIGVKNPKYKRFTTKAEAEAFVVEGKKKSTTASGAALDSRSDNEANLDPEEAARRGMAKSSAPGLVPKGDYVAKDRHGNAFDLARGPLPPGAEDGFDPNIKLAKDGTIVNKTAAEKNKTKLVPKDADPTAMLRIYTDGSSLKNGQAGARAGVGVFFGPQDPQNVSEALKGSKQTNQRAELTAILRALDIAPRHRDLTIYTDSKYSIDCVTNWYRGWVKNGWVNSKGKPVENRDLVQDVRERIEERDFLDKITKFVWVKGHANDVGNIAADQLAVAGAMLGRGAAREATDGHRPPARGDRGTVRPKIEPDDDDDDDGNLFNDSDAEARESLRLMHEAIEEDREVNEYPGKYF